MEMNFDPMTGEPIKKETSKETEEMNFDPMTGEPIKKETMEEEQVEEIEEMNFDPMTGELIKKNTSEETDEMNFDPMTGKPLTSVGGSSFGENAGLNAKRIGGGKSKWMAAIGAIVLVAIVIFAGIKSGLFLSENDKVLLAVANTLKEQPRFMEDLQAERVAGWIADDNYTVITKIDSKDLAMDIQYGSNGKKKQAFGNVSVSGIPDVEFLAQLTEEELKVSLPELVDEYVFTYNYTEENDGYMAEELGDKYIEQINTALKTTYSSSQQEKLTEEICKVILEEYQTLAFEKIENEQFKIDGKKRNCKGYGVVVTEDELLDVLDEVESCIEENDVWYTLYREASAELRQGIRSLPDMEFEFYIYRNKLACIRLDMEPLECEMLFKGGEAKLQDITLVVEEGREYIEIEVNGSVKDSVEKYQLTASGNHQSMELGQLKYDGKSGDFEIEVENGALYVEGKLNASGKLVELIIDEISSGSYTDTELSLEISKGADMKELKGEEFDIGNASRSDFEDIIEKFGNKMLDSAFTEGAAAL